MNKFKILPVVSIDLLVTDMQAGNFLIIVSYWVVEVDSQMTLASVSFCISKKDSVPEIK